MLYELLLRIFTGCIQWNKSAHMERVTLCRCDLSLSGRLFSLHNTRVKSSKNVVTRKTCHKNCGVALRCFYYIISLLIYVVIFFCIALIGRDACFYEAKTYSFFGCYRQAVIDYHLHWQNFLITRKSRIETLVSINKSLLKFCAMQNLISLD